MAKKRTKAQRSAAAKKAWKTRKKNSKKTQSTPTTTTTACCFDEAKVVPSTSGRGFDVLFEGVTSEQLDNIFSRLNR